jgi:hypothetical protein
MSLFSYKADLELDYGISVSHLALESVSEIEPDTTSASLSSFITDFTDAFSNHEYDRLEQIYSENPFEDTFPLSIRPETAFCPLFITALSHCLTSTSNLSFLGLTIAHSFFTRDPSVDIHFLVDLGILPILSHHLSAPHSAPLCLAIAADIAGRGCELRDLAFAQFPPDYLLSILDGNEVEVAHFLLACSIGQTDASAIFHINVRIFEAAITDGGRILDPVMLLCSLRLFHALRRTHTFAEDIAAANIDLRLALVLERKVQESFVVTTEDCIPVFALQLFADFLFVEPIRMPRFDLTLALAFFNEVSDGSGEREIAANGIVCVIVARAMRVVGADQVFRVMQSRKLLPRMRRNFEGGTYGLKIAIAEVWAQFVGGNSEMAGMVIENRLLVLVMTLLEGDSLKAVFAVLEFLNRAIAAVETMGIECQVLKEQIEDSGVEQELIELAEHSDDRISHFARVVLDGLSIGSE